MKWYDRTFVAHVSGGVPSAAMALLAVEKYGDDLRLAFADTLFESKETYDFINSLERAIGLPIVRLNNGQDIWDVFFDRMMLYCPKESGGGCMASYWLKKIPLVKHKQQFRNPWSLIGYTPDESERALQLISRNPSERFVFPLIEWDGGTFFCGCKKIIERHGLKIPSVYENAGVRHNNCARRCIASGVKNWSLLWKDDLAEYLYVESLEQDFMAKLRSLGRKVITILRDRRGGTTKNFSLYQLRQELEQGVRFADDSWRYGGNSCACANAQLQMFNLPTVLA